jgi:hypothetical protein
MIRFWLRFVGIALLFMLVACDQGGTPGPTQSDELEDSVGWFIGNLPQDTWSDGSGPSAVLDLYVSFKSPTIAATDLESAKITNSLLTGSSWTFDQSELANIFYTIQDGDKRIARLAFNNIWSDNPAANGSVLYLGTYTIEVTLKNGKRDTATLTVPAPGSLTASGYSYTYTEDFTGTPSSDYVALPKRATPQSAALNAAGDALAINFSVNDDRIYSGWVLLYDAAGKFLGLSDAFQDFETRQPNPKLNNGQGVFVNGTTNLLSLTAADINLADDVTNFSLGMVKRYKVVLMDGKQYLGTKSGYDTYSISSFATVQ